MTVCVPADSSCRTSPSSTCAFVPGGTVTAISTVLSGNRFQAALAANPENLAARNNLGVALMDQGNVDGAIVTLDYGALGAVA